jgi:hypothetical protein
MKKKHYLRAYLCTVIIAAFLIAAAAVSITGCSVLNNPNIDLDGMNDSFEVGGNVPGVYPQIPVASFNAADGYYVGPNDTQWLSTAKFTLTWGDRAAADTNGDKSLSTAELYAAFKKVYVQWTAYVKPFNPLPLEVSGALISIVTQNSVLGLNNNGQVTLRRYAAPGSTPITHDSWTASYPARKEAFLIAQEEFANTISRLQGSPYLEVNVEGDFPIKKLVTEMGNFIAEPAIALQDRSSFQYLVPSGSLGGIPVLPDTADTPYHGWLHELYFGYVPAKIEYVNNSGRAYD